MRARIHRSPGGFTLVELVVVMLLLGILAAIALPRFARFDDQARIAVAETTTGAFAQSVAQLHGEWLLAGKPNTLLVAGTSINYTASGWPTSNSGGTSACIEIWNQVLRVPPAIVPYVAGAEPEAWSALGAGSLCLFIHQYGQAYTGSNLQPFFLYQPTNNQFAIQRYNMT